MPSDFDKIESNQNGWLTSNSINKKRDASFRNKRRIEQKSWSVKGLLLSPHGIMRFGRSSWRTPCWESFFCAYRISLKCRIVAISSSIHQSSRLEEPLTVPFGLSSAMTLDVPFPIEIFFYTIFNFPFNPSIRWLVRYDGLVKSMRFWK